MEENIREETGRRASPDPRHGGAICVVDDDASVCDSLTVLLETYGFEVLAFSSGAAFLADERHRQAGCLVVDQHMPGMEGIDLVAALRGERIFLPWVLITGRLDAGIAERADQFGVIAVLEKPFAAARLVELVRAGLEQRRFG
jgi:FixJ family two-component response regulator